MLIDYDEAVWAVAVQLAFEADLECSGEHNPEDYLNVAKMYFDKIEAKEEPKTGRWIVGDKTSVFDLAGVETWAVRMTCSECSFSLNFVEGHTAQYRFCPQCGARMGE